MNTLQTTNRTKPQEILAKAYTRRLTPDEAGGYTASIQEFPGLVAEGDTANEAIKNLDDAAISWLEVSLAHGREVRDPVDFGGYSGKIALRIPRSLHLQVAELADAEGTSINQILTLAISHFVGGKQVINQVSDLLSKKLNAIQNHRLELTQQFAIFFQLENQHSFVTTAENENIVFVSPIGESKKIIAGLTSN